MDDERADRSVGLLRTDDRVVGAWLVLVPQGGGRPLLGAGIRRTDVLAAWRTPEGSSLGAYVGGDVDLHDVPSLVEEARRLGPDRLDVGKGQLQHPFGDVILRLEDLHAEAKRRLTFGGRDASSGSMAARFTADTSGAFLDTLDPDAIRWAKGRGVVTKLGTGWAHVDSTFDPSVPLRAAIDERPGLHQEVLAVWQEHGGPLAPEELDALLAATLVDPPNRFPLHLARRHPEASRAFGATHVRTSKGYFHPSNHVVRCMAPLVPLPASWVPRGDDWPCYLRVADLMSGVLFSLNHRWPKPEATDRFVRLVSARGRWRDLEAALLDASGVSDHELTGAWSDCEDMCRRLVDDVLVPAFDVAGVEPERSREAEATMFRAAWDGMVGRGNLRRLFERSRRWHRALGARDALLASLSGSGIVTTWPKVLPDAEVGDVLVTVLDSTALLRAEGARGADGDGMAGLAHCVGGYGPRCASNEVRVLSVRRRGADGAWVRSSTVEVRLGDPFPVVAQHRGADNRKPPVDDVAAVTAYLGALGATYDPSLGFGPVTQVAVRRGDYDASVSGNWEAVRDWWDTFLTRSHRGLSAAGWVRLTGNGP